MVNVTSEDPGIGAGVLLRALEPLEGIEMMQRFRNTTRLRDIARGPGRLAKAMQIDKRFDGGDLCAMGPLWLGSASRLGGEIRSSTRIGLTRDVSRKWRFFERGNLDLTVKDNDLNQRRRYRASTFKPVHEPASSRPQ